MRKDEFKHRCEMRMKSFGITTEALAAMFGKAKARVIEALRGDNTPIAQSLRVQIDLKLTGLCDEERARVAAEIEAVRGQYPELQGELSVILPEDMIYIVTEDGIPTGVWNPQTKKIQPLEPALMRVTGRKVK
jgi:hypothetical protein